MPLKKSKDKKEKEGKTKDRTKDGKKEQKKDGKKGDKGVGKSKVQQPTAQQMAQMQLEREARQRGHSDPPPDVTLQMQKVRVLPAIPPECTCGRHDSHQHQRQARPTQARDIRTSSGNQVPASQGRTSTSQTLQRQADGNYATMQEVRRAQGSVSYASMQQVRASGTYATVQEVRGSQGVGTYATVNEAMAVNTYASVKDVKSSLVNPTYATVQESRSSKDSDYGTVKARVSQDHYATVQQARSGYGSEPLYSTVQQPLPAQHSDDYATVKEAKAAVAAATTGTTKNENYVTMQQARTALANTTYASAQQVRAAKSAKQAHAQQSQESQGTGGSGVSPTSSHSKSENGKSSNGNGRGPPTLQPLSQRRAEEQKKAAGHPVPEVGEGSEDEMMGDGGFLRGGRLRSSLPVVRSPNKTLEKPLGLVFLIHRNETKRALLPNEVTSIDTVRALFVRSFPESLSMVYFESPSRKIYVLDQGTNVYYELEDLKDVKDRAVLKIYETEAPSVRSPSRSPKTVRSSVYFSGAAQDGSGPHSPAHHTAAAPARNFDQGKAASLPAQSNFIYQQEMAQYGTTAQYAGTMPSTGGQPLSPSHQMFINKIPSNQSSPSRTHPMSQNSPTHHAYVINRDVIYPPPGSPSRGAPLAAAHMGIIPSQRHSVAYIPEGGAGFPPDSRLPQSRSYHDYYEGSSRSGSATPTASDQETSNRMDKMEAQLANLAAWVQTAVVQREPGGSRPGSARSNASLTSDTSAKSTHLEVPVPPQFAPPESENATPVQSPSTPPITGLSDVSSATPTPQAVMTADMQNTIRALNSRAKELKAELRHLRRMQLANAESMRDTFQQTFLKIKEVLSTVPGAQDVPVRASRSRADQNIKNYNDDAKKVEQDLVDLEAAVEELRSDVLNKKCRVQNTEVESMALALSNVSKALADLKGKYPLLTEQMKSVMAAEMEVVVKEEKFIQVEGQRLDTALKRCKKLTGTLYTLKRLASIQDDRDPQPINVPVITQPASADKRNLLENIQAMVPDHQARIQSLETAESNRERKKRLVSNTETLRFEKSLELAQKQLRETKNMEYVQQRQEKLLNGLKQELVSEGKEPLIPLTDTTKRLSSAGNASSEAQAELEDETSNRNVEATQKNLSPEEKDQCQQNGSKSSPVTSQNPPQKPPRTLLHDSSNNGKSNVTKGSQVIEGQVSVKTTANIVVSSEGSHYAVSPAVTLQPCTSVVSGSPGLASFNMTTPGPVHTPPHRGMDIGGTGKPPMPPPTCTSTPVSNAPTKNVTFSPSVTEIIDTSPDQKNRKVPPPPPPRRSSRSSLRVQSPQGTPVRRGVSPPAYENIENFPTKVEGSENGAAGGPPPGMVMTKNGQVPRPQNRTRPLNKFQQELAEGIYANLNRPDLQGQHVNAAKVIHDSTVKEESLLKVDQAGGSDNESNASSVDSQSGTVKRNPKANKDGVQMREGKKTPPPPPVRRSSHLSKAPDVETVKEENERPKSVHEIQQQFIQMEQQHIKNMVQQPQQQNARHAAPQANNPAANTNGNGNAVVWQKQGGQQQGTVNGTGTKTPLPTQNQNSTPPAQTQTQTPTTNGDTHSDSDSSLSVQSIVTKFSTTQTLNSQTSKVVIQRQSVKKCEETEIF